MEFKNILVETQEAVAIIKMNRPAAMNALNTETLKELYACVKQFRDDGKVKVIIITGEGKAFVAGADISEMKDMTPDQARSFSEFGQEVFSFIETMDIPVIAAVNGYALGGGCELALACDFRIASEYAKFGQPEVNLGVTPGFAGTQRLPRLIGTGLAKEMLYTADIIDANTALSHGLANKVVSAEELLPTVLGIAKKIASKGPVAVKMVKDVVFRGLQTDMTTASGYEAEAFAKCFEAGEGQEGMTAFVEKRKPNW